MKYFLDTEFLEGKQDKRFLGIKYGETKPTIDLISIGLVSEDGREYYAISKDFNLWEAWNRYDLEIQSGDMRNHFPEGRKVYWIRENVLNPIFMELQQLEREYLDKQKRIIGYAPCINSEWSYSNFKRLIKKYGKSNKEIAEEIKMFIGTEDTVSNFEEVKEILKPKFYAYYADYDWVVFCQLFGKMIDLPNGFPMYCIDLKQEIDNKAREMIKGLCFGDTEKEINNMIERSVDGQVEEFKKKNIYPKQTNEHNALADTRWNKELYEFLNKI